jgi:hypothetical protein
VTAVIKCLGVAGPFVTANAGRYLESCDFEAFDGRGRARFTDDLAEAMKFANKGEALRFWGTRSRTVPTRPDGKPNRPLTAYHAEIMDVP